jgi:hypothetical protein
MSRFIGEALSVLSISEKCTASSLLQMSKMLSVLGFQGYDMLCGCDESSKVAVKALPSP